MVGVKNVLVIDDDFSSRYLVLNLLQSLGVGDTVHTASNGFEALAVLEKCQQAGSWPELILLDIRMPLTDGFYFLDGMQAMPGLNLDHTKIAILSYYGNKGYRERAAQYPVCAYFQKPLTEQKLRQIIKF